MLLAKNILWWFGHPVVYLLLFPAVAVYYWLIPRYAGRDLVAGHVIAIAWTVAVIANVFVWAHHLYLDYPSGTPQAQINTAMQPITFALVLPSALSLYSLAFTIYRSRFRWTPASTALFFGLVGWLLAGLSGVVNATIALDVAVHNTLWIVGHFHHMAMLNIGLLIFGAIYALLPELSGKALYSEKLAWIHVWTTFVAGMVFFGLWLVQGLDGAPRRWSVLPSQLRHADPDLAGVRLPARGGPGAVLLERAADPARQGRRGDLRRARDPDSVERRRRNGRCTLPRARSSSSRFSLPSPSRSAGTSSAGSTAREAAAATTTAQTSTGGAAAAGGMRRPARQSSRAPAAEAAIRSPRRARPGTSAPRSTSRKPSEALVVQRVTNGKAAMPSFKGQLSEQQIADVAAYVHESTAK